MVVKKKLLDLVRDKIRFKHYSFSTERTYVHWIKHYIFFHEKKHPIGLGSGLAGLGSGDYPLLLVL